MAGVGAAGVAAGMTGGAVACGATAILAGEALGRLAVCGTAGGGITAGAGAAFTAGAGGGGTGTKAGAAACGSAPGLAKEPIGGGPLETGAAGTAARDPGRGGALAAGGSAICPTSGTTLGTGLGTEITGAGLAAAAVLGAASALSSFSAMTVCTVASTHSAPHATMEERSRSEVRMVEGGVTSC